MEMATPPSNNALRSKLSNKPRFCIQNEEFQNMVQGKFVAVSFSLLDSGDISRNCFCQN